MELNSLLLLLLTALLCLTSSQDSEYDQGHTTMYLSVN